MTSPPPPCPLSSSRASPLPSQLVCLVLDVVLEATCEPGVLETMIEVNLRSLGNVTLFDSGSATPVGEPGANPPASVAISQLVSDGINCGRGEGHPTNLITILGLQSVIDFNGPLGNLTDALTTQLGAFNSSAIRPIDDALEELGLADMILLQVARQADPGLDLEQVAQLPDLVANMTALLPADAAPTDPQELAAWQTQFEVLYQGDPPPQGPTADKVADNVLIKQVRRHGRRASMAARPRLMAGVRTT